MRTSFLVGVSTLVRFTFIFGLFFLCAVPRLSAQNAPVVLGGGDISPYTFNGAQYLTIEEGVGSVNTVQVRNDNSDDLTLLCVLTTEEYTGGVPADAAAFEALVASSYKAIFSKKEVLLAADGTFYPSGVFDGAAWQCLQVVRNVPR